MTRVHDMGGRHGDGAVIPEPQGMVPVGVDWQRSALALTLAAGGLGAWSIDTSRHAREKLSPKDYARFSYYEKWIAALADLLAEAGLVTKAELSAGEAASAAPHPKLFTADKVAPALARGTPYTRASGITPAFAPGDRVRTRKGAFAEIRWLDRVVLDEAFLHNHPEAHEFVQIGVDANKRIRRLDNVLSAARKRRDRAASTCRMACAAWSHGVKPDLRFALPFPVEVPRVRQLRIDMARKNQITVEVEKSKSQVIACATAKFPTDVGFDGVQAPMPFFHENGKEFLYFAFQETIHLAVQ